jgi:D-alanyl-lipoteichoic acid acyltransferase DltB (MBOAT superfamily)
VFAVVFFALWPLMRSRQQWRWAFITVASFVFYGWWDWRFLGLLAANGLVDYLVGMGMGCYPRWKRVLLVTSIAANVGTLGLFKYSAFFASNTNALFGTHFPVWHFILPIGISFYTFHSMAYIIDVYRGAVAPTRNLLHFYAYLSLFPHLVAGPIIRGADVLPQLEEWHPPTDAMRWDGLRLIAVGFFKKCVLADNLAPVVNLAFGTAVPAASGPYWWLVMAMFAVQIYCDFSGYSDIARGLAQWMGYRFPLNFNHPYTAISMKDFWQRWHISLSSWFRDYVYIPLGGSRRGRLAAMWNMALTMLISGFWHGASWMFVIWGGLHAAYLTLERLTDWPRHTLALRGGRLLATSLVLVQVLVAWVFFRATSLPQAWTIVRTLFSPSAWRWEQLPGMTPFVVGVLAVAVAWEVLAGMRAGQPAFTGKIPVLVTRFPAVVPALEPALLVLLLTASVFLRGPGATFIYFQF